MTRAIPVIDDVSFEDLMRDPYPVYRWARAMGPVVWISAVNLKLVTRFDDIIEIERHPEIFASDNPRSLVARNIGPNLMRKDGAEHAVERKTVEPSLRPGTAKQCWAPRLERICDEIVSGFDKNGEADLFEAFAGPLAARALIEVLGLREVEWRTVAGWSQSLMDGNSNYSGDPEIARNMGQAIDEIERAIDGSIPYHRDNPNESALCAMLAAGQTTDQIYGNVKVFVGGGHNEPRDAILSLALGLLQNPDQLARVRAEPNLWGAAFEEAVRWISPIGMYPRRLARDAEVSGVALKKDDEIGLCVASANHDENRFEHPELFNLFRRKAPHLAFGSGPHFCAGAWVARMMVSQVAVPRLFGSLPNLRLKNRELVELRGWVFRGPTSLPVVWDA